MKMSANERPLRLWQTERNPEMAGYTGRIFEREVLGECRIRARGYVKFRPALNAVFRHQPSSPYEPSRETRNFHSVVAQEMKNLGMNDSHLGIYTAVGSALDLYHRIDGFFYFEGMIVTLDCTIDPNRDEHPRARVIVTGEDAINGYSEVAKMIAGYFRRGQVCGRKGVL